MLVNVPIDLSLAKIEYESIVQFKKYNRVVIRTNPPVEGALIYMKITNTCKQGQDFECIRLVPNEPGYEPDLINTPITEFFRDAGNGVYEGKYKILDAKTGYITISIYTMSQGLPGVCYDEQEFEGEPIAIREDYQFNTVWTGTNMCGDKAEFLSVRWEGKFVVKESREYEFEIEVDDTVKMCLDGEEIFYVGYGGPNTHVTTYLSAGVYVLLLEYTQKTGPAKVKLNWGYPSSELEPIPVMSFGRETSMFVSDNVEVTCAQGAYFNSELGECIDCPQGTYKDEGKECKECPKGAYNDKTGAVQCEPCIEGTYNDKSGQISFDACLKCPPMTYNGDLKAQHCKECPTKTFNDEYGATECSPCAPECNECYGLLNTQCYLCVPESGVDFTPPSTCQCSKHYYYDVSNNKCEVCNGLCIECFGPSSKECLDCNHPIGLNVANEPYSCVYDCGDGYYRDYYTCKRILSSFNLQHVTVHVRGVQEFKVSYVLAVYPLMK